MVPVSPAALADRYGLLTIADWKAAAGNTDSWYRSLAAGRITPVHPGIARLPGATIVRRLVTVGVLRAALTRHARTGRPGIAVLRQVLDDRALGARPSDSVLEEAFAHLVREQGLPAPTFHAVVVLDGVTYVPDFVYPDARVVIEVDGWAVHGSRNSFERDRERDAHFAAHGWLPTRFTWLQVVRRPALVGSRLRAILARR